MQMQIPMIEDVVKPGYFGKMSSESYSNIQDSRTMRHWEGKVSLDSDPSDRSLEGLKDSRGQFSGMASSNRILKTNGYLGNRPKSRNMTH